MKHQLKAVALFHDSFLIENGTTPKTIDMSEAELRWKLMHEENMEYLDACKNEDLVEIADALGDKLYILCGTILRHGMQEIIEKVFDEIHNSNMSKLGADGKPILREDGKILKGRDYFKPDIQKFLK